MSWLLNLFPIELETFWTALLAIATAALAAIAWVQARYAISSQKQWATLQACDRYDSDLLIQKAVEELKEFGGRTFSEWIPGRLNATRIMNYFGAIAIGMQQGFYDKEIAEAHLKTILFSRYRELIQAGWLSIEQTEQDFPEVLWLMAQWRDVPARRRGRLCWCLIWRRT